MCLFCVQGCLWVLLSLFNRLVIKHQEFGPRPVLAEFYRSASMNSDESSFKMDISLQESGRSLFAKKSVVRLLDDGSPQHSGEGKDDETSQDKKHVKQQVSVCLL